MKKTYKIPVTYSSFGTVEVEANSLEEAIEYAKNNIDELPLPYDPDYIDGSYKIDEDMELINMINQ